MSDRFKKMAEQLRARVPGGLRNRLRGKRRQLLGIDAGSFALKGVVASGAPQTLRIEHIFVQARGESPDLLQPRHDDMVKPIRLLVADRGLISAPAALSLADEKVESQDFKLPQLGRKELETAIEWEIKKHLASPNSVYREVLTHEGAQGFEVNCVMASCDLVKSRFEEAKDYGLAPMFLETESSALLACAQWLSPNTTLHRVALLDLGFSSFRLIFVHHGRVSFTRSLYFGLGTIGTQGALPLNVGATEAMMMLKEVGSPTGSPATGERAAQVTTMERLMQESLYTLCEEFRRSEIFARDQRGLEDIDSILLCGGGACLPAATDYLRRHLSEKKLEVLNPFREAPALPAGIDRESGPMWACALGLAMRES